MDQRRKPVDSDVIDHESAHRAPRWWQLALAVAAVWLAGACENPDATTWVVDSLVDAPSANPGDGECVSTAGGCTLRAALEEANTNPHADTIQIGDDHTYTLTSGLHVHEPVTITGHSVIDADDSDRALEVHTGRLTLSGPTVTGGASTHGAGALVHPAAELTVVDSHWHDNHATAGAGAIHNDGTTRILLAAFTHNTGTTAGAIASPGLVTFQQVTLSTNTATTGPGALAVTGTTPASLRWTTITNNTATTTGGITGPASAFASVIADQAVGADCGEPLASAGYNADSDTTCLVDPTTGDQPGIDPQLGSLEPNDARTPTHLPHPDSLLTGTVDAPDCGSGDGAVDQRLQPRPATGRPTLACDTGAAELQPADLGPVVNHGGDDIATDPESGVCQDASGGPGHCSLRAAIDVVNANPHIRTITIHPDVEIIILTRTGTGDDTNTTGDLDIIADVVIEGNGATIDAAGIDRVLDIRWASVELHEVVITGGLTPEGGDFDEEPPGGGIQAEGAHLTIVNSAIVGNTSTSFGGGMSVDESTTVIRNSLIADNVADIAGGGLYLTEGTALITNSTLSGNETPLGGGSSALWTMTELTIEASTIAGNGAGNNASAIVNWEDLAIVGSILDNPGGNCDGLYAVTSGGFNVASDTTCALTGTGDLQDTDPQLGPLDNNGGPTNTHLPATTSPAVGAIPVGTPGLCDGTITVDQRGLPRPQGAGCDAGAVERQPTDP